VGEAMCPHLIHEHTLTTPLSILSPTRRKEKGMGMFWGPTDSDSEQPILSPVRDVTEISFLDLS